MKKPLALNKLLLNRSLSTNIIVDNPQELEVSKTRKMYLKDFAKLHGFRFRKKQFKDELRNFRIEGKPVFKFVDDGHNSKKAFITVNPCVYKPMNESSNSLLKQLFN